MILRTQTIDKNINKQIRKEIAMAMRLIRRTLILNRNPPLEEIPQEFGITLKRGIIALLIISIAFGIMCLFSGCVQAKEVDSQKAIKSIIGEAENQGFNGMLAIAHAIRNRGNLKGVYGLNAPRVRRHLYSRDIYQEATLAWEKSAIDYDITHGATGWGNSDDVRHFEMCQWWGHCVVTAKIKDHVFYKEAR